MEMLSTVLTNKIVVKLGYISMSVFYLVVYHCFRFILNIAGYRISTRNYQETIMICGKGLWTSTKDIWSGESG